MTPVISTQRGVALLTILVMVALATILATALMKKQQRLIRETGVLLRQGQAFEYALAGETALRGKLIEDEKTNSKTDALTDVWAIPMPAFTVEDGAVITSSRLEDLSGKFNLNNLVDDTGQPNAAAIAYFSRLLTLLGQQPTLAAALVDWLDADSNLTANGAEDDYYHGLQPPSQAANQRLVSVTELKQVKGFDDHVYAAIVPYVMVAPKSTPININTASATVLAALDPRLSVADVQGFMTAQLAKKTALDTVASLWTQNAFRAVADKSSTLNSLLDVKTTYYRATVIVDLDGRQKTLHSTLLRQGAVITTIARDMQ